MYSPPDLFMRCNNSSSCVERCDKPASGCAALLMVQRLRGLRQHKTGSRFLLLKAALPLSIASSAAVGTTSSEGYVSHKLQDSLIFVMRQCASGIPIRAHSASGSYTSQPADKRVRRSTHALRVVLPNLAIKAARLAVLRNSSASSGGSSGPAHAGLLS